MEYEFIKNLEKEIKEIEQKIKNRKKNNTKNYILKKKSAFKLVQKSLIPFYIGGILTIPFYKLLGLGYPLIMDETKQEKTKITTIQDNQITNKVEYRERVYENHIKYYGTWKKIPLGYKRIISYYEYDDNLENLTEENLYNLRLINSNEEIIFSKPNDLEKTKIEILTYDDTNKEYILKRESFEKNAQVTIIECTSLGILYIINKFFRSNEINEKIKDLENTYPTITKYQTKLLEKKLVIKRKNLDLLNGEDYE
ncbi:MAG: hypothetical protein RSD06_04930 [Bacilli bacterium]